MGQGHVERWVTAADFELDERHAILFGLQGTRLGAAAAASPISETRNAAVAYAGLGRRL